jgi:molybdopterin-guanine dinucleotide biosynthesis protein A
VTEGSAVGETPPLRVAGAVLTGGGSRRMGVDKALLEIDGVALARRVHDALLAGGCAPVVAIGGDAPALTALGLDVVPDAHPGDGPLGAIVTALEALAPTGADIVVVLACDLADADAAAVRAVLAPFRGPLGALVDAVVPRSPERRHMHHVAWRTSALPVLRAAFAEGERAPRRVLERLAVHELSVTGLDERWLADLDTPADVEQRRRSA